MLYSNLIIQTIIIIRTDVLNKLIYWVKHNIIHIHLWFMYTLNKLFIYLQNILFSISLKFNITCGIHVYHLQVFIAMRFLIMSKLFPSGCTEITSFEPVTTERKPMSSNPLTVTSSPFRLSSRTCASLKKRENHIFI